jgi:hypothetical protein
VADRKKRKSGTEGGERNRGRGRDSGEGRNREGGDGRQRAEEWTSIDRESAAGRSRARPAQLEGNSGRGADGRRPRRIVERDRGEKQKRNKKIIKK